MSKEEAWKDIESAYWTLCQEFCVGKCHCEKRLTEIKEALSV